MPIVTTKTKPAKVGPAIDFLETADDVNGVQAKPVDEYVELKTVLLELADDPAVKKLTVVRERLAALEKEFRADVQDEDGGATLTITGDEHVIQLSPAAEKREVTDKARLIKAIQALPGGDQLLFDLMSIPLGKVDSTFGKNTPQGQLGITVSRDGTRKISVIS